MITLGIVAAIIFVFGIGMLFGKEMKDASYENLIGGLFVAEIVLIIVAAINLLLRISF